MILLLVEMWPYVYKTITSFSVNVILRSQPSKFSIPIVLDLKSCQKCRNFCGKMFEISQKLHGGDRKHIRISEKKNLKVDRWVIFHPYANFNCPYLKTGMCDLFLFVGAHHIYGILSCSCAWKINKWQGCMQFTQGVSFFELIKCFQMKWMSHFLEQQLAWLEGSFNTRALEVYFFLHVLIFDWFILVNIGFCNTKYLWTT